MKLKGDFITNSSSSSFIVIFPKKIESIEDLINYMPKWKAEVVFNDAKEQVPLKINLENTHVDTNLIDIIYGILLERIDKYTCDDIISEIKTVIKDKYKDMTFQVPIEDHINLKIKETLSLSDNSLFSSEFDSDEFKELMIKNDQGFIYSFSYSDEDGDFGSKMEHGGTFDELPHIRISHH